jgi:uncharacterized protein
MTDLRFDPNPEKAASNLTKHGVTFEEAATSFLDTSAAGWYDEAHSSPGDERYINLGYSTAHRLLFVVHNEEDRLIRIISARPATPAERAIYEEA